MTVFTCSVIVKVLLLSSLLMASNVHDSVQWNFVLTNLEMYRICRTVSPRTFLVNKYRAKSSLLRGRKFWKSLSSPFGGTSQCFWHYHLASWSWQGPGDRGNRHISLEEPASSSQAASHSASVMNELRFPLQPPKLNSAHWPLSSSNP